MCQYGYYYFRSCSHRTIELHGHCRSSLLEASGSGVIRMCRPHPLAGRSEPITDVEGADRSTVTPGQAPAPARPWILQPGLVDWKVINGFCPSCVSVLMLPPTHYLPSFSSERLSDDQVDEILVNASLAGPELHIPELSCTIPDLMGVGGLFPEVGKGPEILFPGRVVRATWWDLLIAMPWKQRGC